MLKIVNIYLFWGACQDLQKRKITDRYLWIGGILGMIYRVVNLSFGRFTLGDWIAALVPGILILFIAKITREKIGLGDGWVFLILGNFLSIGEIWYLLQISVILAVLSALALLCSRKATKEYQIPFLPFLWVAYTLLFKA